MKKMSEKNPCFFLSQCEIKKCFLRHECCPPCSACHRTVFIPKQISIKMITQTGSKCKKRTKWLSLLILTKLFHIWKKKKKKKKKKSKKKNTCTSWYHKLHILQCKKKLSKILHLKGHIPSKIVSCPSETHLGFDLFVTSGAFFSLHSELPDHFRESDLIHGTGRMVFRLCTNVYWFIGRGSLSLDAP